MSQKSLHQQAEGIAYSSAQHIDSLSIIDTERDNNAHWDVLHIDFNIDEINKEMEDLRRSHFFGYFYNEDGIGVSRVNDTHITVYEKP